MKTKDKNKQCKFSICKILLKKHKLIIRIKIKVYKMNFNSKSKKYKIHKIHNIIKNLMIINKKLIQ